MPKISNTGGLANSFEEYKSKAESSEPSDNKNLTKDCPICGFPKEGKNSYGQFCICDEP